MEYRGYDSAGVATLEKENFQVIKTKGKVAALDNELKAHPSKSCAGIGHTRWATHGEPNQKNAHPHLAGKVVLVHNGIIENYEDLKTALQKKGVKFKSDTDTEVLAQLINYLYENNGSIEDAVFDALNQCRGAFGIAVLCADDPNKIIAARRGSPLIVGRKAKEMFVASDATALVGKADEVLYLEDDDVAVCTPGDISVANLERTPQKRVAEKLDLEVGAIQKQGYDHFLIKEIFEQPKSAEAVLAGHLLEDEGSIRLGGLNMTDKQIRDIERIQVIACGTAFYSGLLSKYLIEQIAGIPVDVEVASEFRYRNPVLADNTVAFIISQSGETADTMACLTELNNRGVHTLGIVNAVGSSIARTVKGGVYLHAGPEISVASTKAFTSMVLAQLQIGLHFARKRGSSLQQGQEIVRALRRFPSDIEKVLKLNGEIKKQAKILDKFDNAMYLGRDTLFPVAMEGALKLKEISYIHAEGYGAGEMKHGPIALVDDKFLIVALLGKGPMLEKSISNLQEVKARGGAVLVVTDDDSVDEPNMIYVPTDSPWTSPLLINIALQMLAYHGAVARGTDVDMPRNLAKSVTVE